MSFIEEADSLASKLHMKRLHPLMILGAVVAVCLVVAIVGQNVFNLVVSGATPTEQNDSVVVEDAQVEETQTKASVFVHVAGAVVAPGLYELEEDARIQDAIQAAGGFAEGALTDSINLAQVVTDGEQIVVQQQAAAAAADGSGGAVANSGVSADGKININTASESELMELDGVGEATAAKIIDHRNSEGRFKTIEDLMEVSGIGEKKFEALKDSICV